MDIQAILSKPIFKKWWFWVIIAVVRDSPENTVIDNYIEDEISWGDGSCIVEEYNENILYAIIFFNEYDLDHILKLSGEIKNF